MVIVRRRMGDSGCANAVEVAKVLRNGKKGGKDKRTLIAPFDIMLKTNTYTAATQNTAATDNTVVTATPHTTVTLSSEEEDVIEVSVHSCPPSLVHELKSVFPKVDARRLLIVPTFQRSLCSLLSFDDVSDIEKDRLLNNFLSWGAYVCERLKEQGEWADITDPASGFPVLSERGPSPYPDVHGSLSLLRYDQVDTGICTLVAHPRWGTNCYPATLFTTAPLETLKKILGAGA